jgi:hypothetical protein
MHTCIRDYALAVPGVVVHVIVALRFSSRLQPDDNTLAVGQRRLRQVNDVVDLRAEALQHAETVPLVSCAGKQTDRHAGRSIDERTSCRKKAWCAPQNVRMVALTDLSSCSVSMQLVMMSCFMFSNSGCICNTQKQHRRLAGRQVEADGA